MRRRGAALLLVLAVAATWMLTDHLSDRSALSTPTSARGQSKAEPAADTSRPEPGTLRTRNGVAEVVDDSGSKDRQAEALRYWFGLVIDGRTRLGEEGATIHVESLDPPRRWPGGRSVASGAFVIAVPRDLDGARSLRLVCETSDGRVGIRSVRAPREEAFDIGRIRVAATDVVRGSCSNERNQPAVGSKLQLRTFGELRVDPGVVAECAVNEDGSFEFTRVPRGMYVLEGRSAEGELFLHAPVVVPQNEPLTVEAVPSSTLWVSVQGSDGRPAVDVNVNATLIGPSAERDPLGPQQLLSPVSAKSDAAGLAVLDRLPKGTYRVRIESQGNAFDFVLSHTVKTLLAARLTIPSDPRIYLRCYYEDRAVAAGLKLLVETPTGPLTLTTSDDGVINVDRGVPPVARVAAQDSSGTFRGEIAVPHDKIVEGQVAGEIVLKGDLSGDKPRRETRRKTPRFAIVKTPEGLPVRGARVSGGGRVVRTDAKGRAALGELADDDQIRLRRDELASGWPTSGKLGGTTTHEFVWNLATRVHLTVTDEMFGFRLDRGVRVGAQSNAAKRVGPGEYVTFWDAPTARPGLKLVITAPGYEAYILEPPGTGAASVRQSVELARIRDNYTGSLSLQVRAGLAPVVGARVSGRCNDRRRHDAGRRSLVAVSADNGEVFLRGLAPGRWSFTADGGLEGAGSASIGIRPGTQRLTVSLPGTQAHLGLVMDEDKRPLAGVAITVRGHDGVVARTKADGQFPLNLPLDRSEVHRIRAAKVGYTPTYVDWTWKKGRWDRRTIVLRPTIDFALPLRWRRGADGPIPRDLRFEMQYSVPRHVIPRRIRVRLEDNRLVVSDAPRQDMILHQLAGSAYVSDVRLELDSRGELPEKAVVLHRGVTVVGQVKGARGIGAWALVSIRVSGHAARVGRADEGGRFAIHGVPPGRLAIEVQGQSPASRNRNAKLNGREGETVRVVVERN